MDDGSREEPSAQVAHRLTLLTSALIAEPYDTERVRRVERLALRDGATLDDLESAFDRARAQHSINERIR